MEGMLNPVLVRMAQRSALAQVFGIIRAAEQNMPKMGHRQQVGYSKCLAEMRAWAKDYESKLAESHFAEKQYLDEQQKAEINAEEEALQAKEKEAAKGLQVMTEEEAQAQADADAAATAHLDPRVK